MSLIMHEKFYVYPQVRDDEKKKEYRKPPLIFPSCKSPDSFISYGFFRFRFSITLSEKRKKKEPFFKTIV